MPRCVHSIDKQFCTVCQPRSPIAVAPRGTRRSHEAYAMPVDPADKPPSKGQLKRRGAKLRVVKAPDQEPTTVTHPSVIPLDDRYASLEEVMEAVRKIPEIVDWPSYRKHRTRDPRLSIFSPLELFGRQAWEDIGGWPGLTGHTTQTEVA